MSEWERGCWEAWLDVWLGVIFSQCESSYNSQPHSLSSVIVCWQTVSSIPQTSLSHTRTPSPQQPGTGLGIRDNNGDRCFHAQSVCDWASLRQLMGTGPISTIRPNTRLISGTQRKLLFHHNKHNLDEPKYFLGVR